MDEKMEIRLVNPTEDGFLQKIDWNKAELEANVRSIVEAYQGLVYTEDTVSDAKNDRAALRKLLNEIEDRRKLVKKKCMEPYEVFENDLKDVTVLIKEQISIIDGQVKEYENGVKEEKKARLQDVYAETIGELAEVLPFERVFETQYLNVSFKESKAATEIQEKIQRVKSDLAAIDALDSKYKLNAKDVYVRTLDMSQDRIISMVMKMERDAAAQGKDLVLLCYEDVRIPEDWCHRTVFAEWWVENTGEIIEELPDPNPPKGKKVSTASEKPEVQAKPDDGYQQMSLFGMGALI